MPINALTDKARVPDDTVIAASLCETFVFFAELRAATAAYAQEWRHYGKKYGWKCKVHADDKTLLELTVADGWFLVTMAIRETERAALSADPAMAALADPRHAAAAQREGYGIKIEVRDRASYERAVAIVRFITARRP